MYHGERFNSISHLVGAGLALFGAVLLIVTAARLGDPTVHGGVIVVGFPTVMIGIPGQGSVLQAAAATGAPFCEK